MSQPMHAYTSRIIWEGNLGRGTIRYDGYSRTHRIAVEGKPDLMGSADATFRGEPDKHNPEELFLASIAACHMLFYLSLCARRQLVVVAYEDAITGTLKHESNGGGKFHEITLHPKVTIARAQDRDAALALHETAHQLCFIASSCAAPIHHVAIINVAHEETSS